MNTHNRRLRHYNKSFSFTLISLFLIALFISLVDAKDGDVEDRGLCSQGSKWKLKLRPRGTTSIEVDFDAENKVIVKQNWKILIRNNKKTVYQKTVPAGTSIGDDNDDDGTDDSVDDDSDDSFYLFDITTIIPANPKKTDTVVARATGSKTGEVCTGTLVLP
jgi:hypothetical protein